MIRLLASVAATPPAPVKQIDVIEAGRVLATLDDWRGIMLSQMVVIGVLVLLVVGLVAVIVWLSARRSVSDQATISALTDNTKALSDITASVRALELIAARREAEKV
ncbi:MAG: hypothetical protein FJ335_07480 [Sphingomonadales bacterium]|nr:hypothetical protein [Sphingomonadales bacterium]